MSDLVNALTTLGLRHTAAHLDDVVALATKRRWSTTQLLEHLAESEQQERTRRSLERRLLRSRLGRFTPMSHFDWAWPKRIDRPTVEATLRLDFLAGARNVVLVAPQGLGKTMIAQNIAHAAVLAGHHVLFKTAAELLLDLRAVLQKTMLACGVTERPHDLPSPIDAKGLGTTEHGNIDRGEAGPVKEKASPVPTSVEIPHDLARIVDPAGIGQSGAGRIDGSEGIDDFALGALAFGG